MGHSFFRPSVEMFNLQAAEWGIQGHDGHSIFRGGQNGSPLRLWQNNDVRNEATEVLSGGQIELLTLTYYSAENSRVEDYQRWFDLALVDNPEITFLVTIPWTLRPHLITEDDLEELRARTLSLFDSLIAPLRERYPDNEVIFCPYGLGAYELVESFFDGELTGVEFLSAAPSSNRGDEYLFRDATGHPNELLVTLSTLIWAATLYDIDSLRLDPVRVPGLPEVDVNAFASEVAQVIAPYNEGNGPSLEGPVVRAALNASRTQLLLSWLGETGQRYEIESSSNLDPDSWTSLGIVDGSKGELIWMAELNTASRFFRVVPTPPTE